MSPRDRILARRAKFMAAAVMGIVGCSASTSDPTPQVCLSPDRRDVGVDTGDAAADASDTEPMTCLTSPVDSAMADTEETSIEDTSAKDTGPMPCLVPPLDSGS